LSPSRHGIARVARSPTARGGIVRRIAPDIVLGRADTEAVEHEVFKVEMYLVSVRRRCAAKADTVDSAIATVLRGDGVRDGALGEVMLRTVSGLDHGARGKSESGGKGQVCDGRAQAENDLGDVRRNSDRRVGRAKEDGFRVIQTDARHLDVALRAGQLVLDASGEGEAEQGGYQ